MITSLEPSPSAESRSRHRGSRRRARRSIRKPIVRSVIGLAVVGVAAIAWLVWRGIQAKDHLMSAASEVSQLQTQIDNGDTAAARTTLISLQNNTKAAHAETSDPVWHVVGAVPFVGRNTSTVAKLAASIDDLATRALPPLVQASTLDLRRLAPHGGQVDLAALQAVAKPVASADQAVRQIEATIGALPTSDLVPPVHDALARMRTELASAAHTTGVATKAVTLLPAMLGANGPRTYAVLFMTNAELRADGGIAGSWVMVRADHGRVEIVNQGSDSDVNSRITAVAVPADVASVFTNRAGGFFQDVTLTPNYPAAAQLAASMLQQAYGVPLDGVLATDPVALGELLKATGPVTTLTGQQLTADNAAALLMSDIYREVPDPLAQDAFFGGAAKAVFDALAGGQGDPRAVVQSLATAADGGRLSVWSAHPAEEEQLRGTPLAGVLPVVDVPGQPSIGVFFDDGTAAKLDYYLHAKVDVSGASCPATRAGYHVRVALTSTVPASAATSLPAYVVGRGAPGLALGTIRTQVYVYAPTGGAVLTATLDGATAPLGAGVESGRAVGIITVDLAPGQTKVLDVGVVSGVMTSNARTHGVAPTIRVTPMAVTPLLHSAAAPCLNS